MIFCWENLYFEAIRLKLFSWSDNKLKVSQRGHAPLDPKSCRELNRDVVVFLPGPLGPIKSQLERIDRDCTPVKVGEPMAPLRLRLTFPSPHS